MTRIRSIRVKRSGSRRSAPAAESRVGGLAQTDGISPHRVAGVTEQALTSVAGNEISPANSIKFGELNSEDVTMTEEQTKKAPKTPEEIKALEQKRELRGLREQTRTLREKSKALLAERAEVSARYKALTEEMGLPQKGISPSE